MLLCLVLLFAAPAAAFLGFGKCELTKADLLPCALKKCDFNGDGRLSLLESRFIFEEVLTGANRWAAAQFTSPQIAIDHCGDVETGYVTAKTFMESEKCIEWCYEKRVFKRVVCDVLEDSDVDSRKLYVAFLKKNGLVDPDLKHEAPDSALASQF